MLQIRHSQPFINLFDDLMTMPLMESEKIMKPIHDIIENDKEYIVNMYLAGIKKENISVDVERDVLTIKAERKDNKEYKYNRKESFTGMYQKIFELAEDIDKENIDASFEDGVLKVVIPKIKNEKKLSKSKIVIK